MPKAGRITTEQMMLDEGYGNGDPKLRMGQLEDALLRNARYIVGIQMHTGNMTVEQAKQSLSRRAIRRLRLQTSKLSAVLPILRTSSIRWGSSRS